jgi:hypothetical protein
LRYRLRHCFGLGSTVGHPASRLSALNRRLSCRAGSAEMLWAFRVSNRLTVEVADVLAVEARSTLVSIPMFDRPAPIAN